MERSDSVDSLDDILKNLNSDSDESFSDNVTTTNTSDDAVVTKRKIKRENAIDISDEKELVESEKFSRLNGSDEKSITNVELDDAKKVEENVSDFVGAGPNKEEDGTVLDSPVVLDPNKDSDAHSKVVEKEEIKIAVETKTEDQIHDVVTEFGHKEEVQEVIDCRNTNIDLIELNNNVVVNKNETEAIVLEGVTESESHDADIVNNNAEETDTNKLRLEGVTQDETDDFEERKVVKVTRSQSIRSHNEEDIINQFLDLSNDDAEARLLARRQARAEAREIRMRELERQQKEQEENADRQFDMLAEPVARATRTVAGSRYLSSRRSSEDSLEDGGGSLLGLRHELKEVEEKFKKAMIANAQLDNDKAAQTYQLELFKDRLEELEEEHSQLKREHRDKCREHDQLKRLSTRLNEELAVTKAELEERDRLIGEKGLVIVGEDLPSDEEPSDGAVNGFSTPKKALVSVQNAQLLENAGEGSLDVRLERFMKERVELQDQISHLKLELEEEKSKRRKSNASGVTLNGPTSDPDYDAADIQREVGKQLADYKFRAQKAEQDVATLQATVARLESQVIRYKSAAEVSEKSEEALKSEKRKLQREDTLSSTSSFDDSISDSGGTGSFE